MDNKIKILLIGSDGYIGSALQIDLKKKFDLTCVDNDLHREGNNINTLVNDFNLLDEDFIQSFDVVILLAGHSSVKMCEGDICCSYKNNVRNFIDLSHKLNKKTKFIYASSSSVYGKCSTTADENCRDFIPYNNYDVTKHFIDLYISRTDIEYYGLRFGTVNGYSPNLRNDIMINAMFTNGINNGNIDLYIKNIMRPILGINDLIRAINKILESKEDKRGIYNLASFNKSAEEIANTVGLLINKPVIEKEVSTITNSKLQTIFYDFQINSNKFEETFDFKFMDSIESIVNSLKIDTFKTTNRSKFVFYE